MSMWERDFEEIYRLRFEATRDAQGAELIAALRSWFVWLNEALPTIEILKEIVLEAEAAVAVYGSFCARTLERLKHMEADVANATADLEQSIADRTAGFDILEGAKNFSNVLADLDERSVAPKLPSSWRHFPESPISAFRYLRLRVIRSKDCAEASDACRDRGSRTDPRQELIDYIDDSAWNVQAQFASLIFPLVGRGVHSLSVLHYLMGCLHVRCTQIPIEPGDLPSVDPMRTIMSAVFPSDASHITPSSNASSERLREWVDLLRQHAENLFREVLFRMANKRRLTTELNRYGTRAERFDRDRLIDLVKKHPGRVEAMLAADCAKYLFDCGIDVATEVSLGNIRADIVAAEVYVEAKQISGRTRAKPQIVSAYHQAIGSARRLRDRVGGVPPIVLVIFLVGDATRIEVCDHLPAREGSPEVWLQIVDLRVENTGSSEVAAKVIKAEDFSKPARRYARSRRRS